MFDGRELPGPSGFYHQPPARVKPPLLLWECLHYGSGPPLWRLDVLADHPQNGRPQLW